MKDLAVLGVALAVAGVGFAQQRGVGIRNHPFSISDPSYASRLQATVSGTPGYTGAPTGGGRAPRVVPVYMGGYYYYPPAPSVVVVAPQQAPAPSTQVYVNQFYTPETAKPLVREYGENGEEVTGVRVYSVPTLKPATAEEPAAKKSPAKPTLYLVAFKDNSLVSAMALWREAGKLHYVTAQGDHKSAPLENFDQEYTEQLNRERGLEFQLKGK